MDDALTYSGEIADYRNNSREGLAARQADARLTAAIRAAHGRPCVRCTRCGRCTPTKKRTPTPEELAALQQQFGQR